MWWVLISKCSSCETLPVFLELRPSGSDPLFKNTAALIFLQNTVLKQGHMDCISRLQNASLFSRGIQFMVWNDQLECKLNYRSPDVKGLRMPCFALLPTRSSFSNRSWFWDSLRKIPTEKLPAMVVYRWCGEKCGGADICDGIRTEVPSLLLLLPCCSLLLWFRWHQICIQSCSISILEWREE